MFLNQTTSTPGMPAHAIQQSAGAQIVPDGQTEKTEIRCKKAVAVTDLIIGLEDIAGELNQMLNAQLSSECDSPDTVNSDGLGTNDWKPIDTAPTDGTCVLVTNGHIVEVSRCKAGVDIWGVDVKYWMPIPAFQSAR